MSDAPILSDDDPYSMPSMPTMRGGDPDALGRIDHYDLLRKLGGGGFGVVYLARDTASGVEVAIKTLHPLIKRNAEEMDLLREKFGLVSRLAHPNIATALVLHPVRDIHVWDDAARAELKLSPGDSVMVMRYAPGVTLSRWRRQFPDGVVPPDLALEIGRQVAAALDYAHGERIVHRDIKPGNIMVETLGGASRPGEPQSPDAAARRDASPHRIRARILDFGLAAEIRSSMSRVSTEQGDTSGTRPYMAPEQWLGKKQDGRTDQYALACVLYELLSGAPPFAGVFETGDPVIMRTAVTTDAPDEIEEAAPVVNAALLRALAKSPKDRFPSCATFVAAMSSTTEHTKDTEDGDEATPRLPSASGRVRSPSAPQDSAALEADVLRRKVALARVLAAISVEDRNDAEWKTILADAEIESDAAKEAIDRNRIAAAAACFDRAETALERLREAKNHRKAEAERIAREEAERTRKARELEEAARRAWEEKEQKLRELKEAARRAREEEVSHPKNGGPIPETHEPDERVVEQPIRSQISQSTHTVYPSTSSAQVPERISISPFWMFFFFLIGVLLWCSGEWIGRHWTNMYTRLTALIFSIHVATAALLSALCVRARSLGRTISGFSSAVLGELYWQASLAFLFWMIYGFHSSEVFPLALCIPVLVGRLSTYLIRKNRFQKTMLAGLVGLIIPNFRLFL